MSESTLGILERRFGATPCIKLEECIDLLGYGSNEAIQRAAWDRSLGIATFRLRQSQKAPRMVTLVALAKHIDGLQTEAEAERQQILSY